MQSRHIIENYLVNLHNIHSVMDEAKCQLAERLIKTGYQYRGSQVEEAEVFLGIKKAEKKDNPAFEFQPSIGKFQVAAIDGEISEEEFPEHIKAQRERFFNTLSEETNRCS